MKTKPIEVTFGDTPNTIHDIDMFAHGSIDWNYKDVVPLPDGQTLAGMFPRGANIKIPAGKAGRTFVKKWYWIWSKYDRLIAALTSNLKWKNLPDEIKPWNIENIINKNGSAAFLNLNGKYVIINYDVKVKNIYGEPLSITIEHPDEEFNGKEYKEGSFVIIQNQQNNKSTFNDIIQYLEGEYVTLESIRRNTFTSQPKGIFLQNAYTEEHGVLKPLAMSLNAIAESNDTFYTLSLSEQETRAQKQILGDQKIDNIFVPIEFTDRIDNLIKEQQFWDKQMNDQVGLSTSIKDKKEKLIGAEIETENSVAQSILEGKVNIRKDACEKINKIFGLKMSIELEEPEQIIEKEYENTKKKKGKKND